MTRRWMLGDVAGHAACACHPHANACGMYDVWRALNGTTTIAQLVHIEGPARMHAICEAYAAMLNCMAHPCHLPQTQVCQVPERNDLERVHREQPGRQGHDKGPEGGAIWANGGARQVQRRW
eukprot:359394-Chlamydomonas_euryale.AAC.6